MRELTKILLSLLLVFGVITVISDVSHAVATILVSFLIGLFLAKIRSDSKQGFYMPEPLPKAEPLPFTEEENAKAIRIAATIFEYARLDKISRREQEERKRKEREANEAFMANKGLAWDREKHLGREYGATNEVTVVLNE